MWVIQCCCCCCCCSPHRSILEPEKAEKPPWTIDSKSNFGRNKTNANWDSSSKGLEFEVTREYQGPRTTFLWSIWAWECCSKPPLQGLIIFRTWLVIKMLLLMEEVLHYLGHDTIITKQTVERCLLSTVSSDQTMFPPFKCSISQAGQVKNMLILQVESCKCSPIHLARDNSHITSVGMPIIIFPNHSKININMKKQAHLACLLSPFGLYWAARFEKILLNIRHPT